MERLKEAYKEAIVPEMTKKFGYKNGFQVPRIEKIVVNMGLSEAKENPKALDSATQELVVITGQKPQICRAKKSIANFKLRQGMAIGLRVTLRGERMYEFLDRLVNCAIPRIRDFRGMNPKSFDRQGNYNLGLTDQQIFPEIDLSKSDKVRGMSITFVTTAKTDEEAKELLGCFGMPFQKK